MNEFDEFEQELRQALERRPAPPGLKRRVMERRKAQPARRTWLGSVHSGNWMKAAAVVVLAAMLGGGAVVRERQIENERRGEAAKRQVMTALRITTRALNQVQTRLAAHDRGGE